MTIKKNDTVRVISGRDRGMQGKVERVLPADDKIVATGLNLRKRHFKTSQARPKGGIVEMPMPIGRAKVMVICPHCSKSTRVQHTVNGDTKYRSCMHCKDSLDSTK